MITAIIIVLVLILAGLLIDWQKVLHKRMPQMPSKLIKSKKEVISLPPLQESAPKSKEFDFDTPVEEVIEQVIPDEEPTSYSANKEVEAMLAEADVHFRKGEMKAAEKIYLKAAAADPRCSRAYSRLGVIYLEEGDNWQDAEEAFRQALKTDPNNGFILNNLGLVLYHQDKYADAIRQFEQAVRQDELNAARHANLGMAYMAMRQYAKAESSFKKALKLNPQEMEYKDLLTESIEKKKAHKTMIRR